VETSEAPKGRKNSYDADPVGTARAGRDFHSTIKNRPLPGSRQTKKCGRGQPPRPHRTWIPVLPLSPHGGGMTASARQRPRSGRARAPHLPKPVAEPQLHQSRTRNRCGGQRPCPCSKEQEGRRPQRPGNQSALTRFSECPPAILSNRRLSLAGPQSVGKLRSAHVFAAPHSPADCCLPQPEKVSSL